MDLIGVLRACIVRWWVFVPVVALTAWLCAHEYRDAEPQFTSTAAVVVAPSESLLYVRGEQTNTGILVTSPFADGNGSRVLAGLLSRALNTATVREQLLPAGSVALSAERDVEADVNVVTLTVVAEDADAARKGIATAVEGANGVAAQVQRDAGVRDGQYLDAVSGGPIDPPMVSYPDRLRAVVGFALAGLLLAVVLSVLAQALLTGRRKERRTAAPAHEAGAGEHLDRMAELSGIDRHVSRAESRAQKKQERAERKAAAEVPRGSDDDAAGSEVASTEQIDLSEAHHAGHRR